ncbi:putative lyase superfamily protein [Pseudomonas phage MR4]|uniref:Putative lyase superfamily protein n=1 Tax=Pseudomonas phage MR4 TaxID=2711171 RepID=A0A6M3TCB2_9CAUD|nr:putative lyase superfamily protein [Pseudomonas phage MR4]
MAKLTRVTDYFVTVKLKLAGAISRLLENKLEDIISVKDFGAVGDGVHDDTAAIQAAINSLYPAGGILYLPRGAYSISSELTVSNMPIEIFGDGMYATRIEQITAGANGIHFISDRVNNAPVTDNLLINSLHIHDMSVNRGLNSGGIAVLAAWGIMTSNSAQAIFERFRVYAKSDAGRCWEGGIDLRNCNGLRVSTVQILGNVLETPLSAADPYTLRYGIRLSNDSSNQLGLISFFVDKLTVIASGIGLSVFGWHEGFEVVNCELVQVAIGIQVIGDAVHKNPDFFYTNSHIEARVKCVVLTNVFKPKFTACDLFHSSAIGYSGSVIELNGCDAFTCTGTTISMQRGSSSYIVSGITSSSSYHGSVSGCNFLGLDNGIDVNADSWVIGDNTFYQVTNPIRLYGNLHTLGVNKFTSCANGVTYVGTGHQITPITYMGSHTLNVTAAGSQQGFVFPIPAGIFRNKPDIVHITAIGGSSTLILSCVYNYASASTTPTGVKVEVTGSASIPAGQYVFGITAMARP